MYGNHFKMKVRMKQCIEKFRTRNHRLANINNDERIHSLLAKDYQHHDILYIQSIIACYSQCFYSVFIVFCAKDIGSKLISRSIGLASPRNMTSRYLS